MAKHPTESPESLAESFAFANAAYSSVQVVTENMKRWWSMLEGILNLSDRETLLRNLWLRSHAWMLTLLELKSSKHYQAHVAGMRAILELTVDILLLCHDKTGATERKMFCFMESEKLRNAEVLVAYFDELGESCPDVYRFQVAFMARNAARIRADRNSTWPTSTGKDRAHPKRWSCRDLFQDVEEVDKQYGAAIVDNFGKELARFYRTEYRKVNWDVHSGFASTFNMPAESFDIRSAFAMINASSLAMLASKFVLQEFRFHEAIPDFESIWRKIREDRDRIFVELMEGGGIA